MMTSLQKRELRYRVADRLRREAHAMWRAGARGAPSKAVAELYYAANALSKDANAMLAKANWAHRR